MTDPQPRHLNQASPAAEPQPRDRSPQEAERVAQQAAADQTPMQRQDVERSAPKQAQSATSPEAVIPRDPQNGQALGDRSLVSGRDSEQSDGASDSMHRPES